MDVGITLTIRNYTEAPEPLTEIYQRNLKDVVYAEQLGFDFVWVSEHHFAPYACAKAVSLWVGDFREPLVTRAGREGYHLQGGGPHLDKYLAALRENGFDPENFNHQLFGSGHLANAWDRAWDEVQDGLYYHRAFYEQREWIAHKTVAPPAKLQPPAEMRHDPETPGSS